MDNKMSLHIVWPFVILWIIVAAMVGGDLIPLHVTDKMGSAGKIVWMMDELLPADDVASADELDLSQTGVVEDTQVDQSVDNQEAFNVLTEDIVQDSVNNQITDPTQTVQDVTQDNSITTGVPVDEMGDVTYILNTNSMKFHKVDCHSAELIAEENFQASFDTRDTIIANGYVPCKNCNP